MGTPVTSQELKEILKEILEGVVRVFQTKLEENSSGIVVAAPESAQVMQRIELLPNDIKLEGTRNYLSWSRRALLNLHINGLEKYVKGECTEPENKTSAEWNTWSNTNSLVISWLLTSVSPTIAGMVESISSAANVWKTLEGMYSGGGSVMMMMEVEEKIDATTQGEKTVHQYATELRHLWADLDHYDPLSLQNPTDVLLGRQYFERRRAARFLKGLNPKFEGRRTAMCHLSSLPSLDEAIASMEQEEIRQKVITDETSPAVRSALVVPDAHIRDERECYDCGKKGHLSYNCPQPRNTGGSQGGREQRGGRAGRGGRRRGGRGVVHLTVAEESQTAVEMTRAEITELEELHQFKLQAESSKGKGQVTQDHLFFKQEMEISLVGLQNTGKTSLVNAIATGGYSEDMVSTVGFNMRKVTKGNVTIKLWDLGGQPRFRSMWERYCRGVSAVLFVVDAADRDNVVIANSELHYLLDKPSQKGIPLLVLGNKIDKSEALSKQALVDQLGLEQIKDREVSCYMISCKDSINIDVVIDWLIKHSRTTQ